MPDIDIIIIAWAASFVVAVCLLIYAAHQKYEKARRTNEHSQSTNQEAVDKALAELNTKATWEKDHNDLVAHFDYQSGHFRLRLENDSPFVRLFYFYFFDAPLSQIELVRSLCNQCNVNAESCRMVYTVNEKNGKVDVHLIDTLLVNEFTATALLRREMKSIFNWQATFVGRYSELKPATTQVTNHDMEKQQAEWSHELSLIREQEIMHQDEGPDWHEHATDPMTLKHVLAVTLGLTDIAPLALDIFTDDGHTRVSVAGDILAYHIHAPLIANNAFVRHAALMRLDYEDPRQPMLVRHLTIDLEDEGQTSDTLYYRATICIAPVAIDPDIPIDNVDNRKRTVSVLLGYDIKENDKLQQKFSYIWKEAVAKQKAGDFNNFTEDEQMLLTLQTLQTRRLYLEGKDLLVEQRYYEALHKLEPVFEALQHDYEEMDTQHQYSFYELCYLIGTCYTCLKQYKLAQYYLQFTLPTHRVTYTEMYINSLVGGNDFRALTIINGLLHDIVVEPKEDDEEGDTESHEPVDTFANFLKRRKAYLLIERKQYPEAESLLRELLDEPESNDFALRELAYIQKNKGKQ